VSDLKVAKPPEGEMYLRWTKGNENAVRLISGLALISQIADDFVDGDNSKVTGSFLKRSDAMAEMLKATFGDVFANPFFQQFQAVLLPLILSSVTYWDASNHWTISRRVDDRMFAFVHREALERVVAMIAYLIGGWSHERTVVREMHEYYHGVGAVQTFGQWDAEVSEVKRA
jgi:hypothetical protein